MSESEAKAIAKAMSDQVALPDRTGVVLGYRAWSLLSDPAAKIEESLRSVVKTSIAHRGRIPWRLDAPTVAMCCRGGAFYTSSDEGSDVGCSDSPQWSCHCGLHAYITPYKDIARYNAMDVMVRGAVVGWGRIIYHENRSFFRAQKMLPIAFMKLGEPQAYQPLDWAQTWSLDNQYRISVEKLECISDALYAPIFDDLLDLQSYAEAEVERW